MNSKSLYLFIGGILFLAVPSVVFGQNVYKPLISIPGITDSSDFGQYINALYSLSISIAALMAVIKIIIAGVKYMLSDVVTNKSEAINDIRSSVVGLIIVISAVLILTEINPKLVETEVILTPVKSAANTPGVAVAGANETGNGYTSAPLTDKAFEASCESKAGSEYRVADGRQVCFEPLNPAQKSFVAAFSRENSDSAVLEKRFQTAHFPMQETDSAKIDKVIQDNGGTRAPLVLKYEEPYGAIDKENVNTIVSTCLEYKAKLNNPSFQVQPIINSKDKYIACVVTGPVQ